MDKTSIRINCKIQHDKNIGSLEQLNWATLRTNVSTDTRREPQAY